MPWDPDRYEQFKKERYLPFEDLLRLVHVREGLRVVDLGCGTGELTRRLADALPASDVLGIDSSAEMLAKAQELARPGLRFEQRVIEELDGTFDLVFSNAAIQWVRDHEALIPRLFAAVAAGGQIVVQMPNNFNHPTYAIMLDLSRAEPHRSALGGFMWQWPVLSAEEYAQLLFDCGGEELTVFEKIYPHVLPDADALADWMSGTALVPYFERMDDGGREAFMAAFRDRLRERFPERPLLFGFRRTLFAASKP